MRLCVVRFLYDLLSPPRVDVTAHDSRLKHVLR